MRESIDLPVKLLPHHEGLPLPSYQTEGAAGLDLPAAVAEEGVLLPAGGRLLLPTGLAAAVPEGYEGQVRPRSGLAAAHGLTVLNSPGTIDSDYRGEIKVLLINLGREDFLVERGMRIAQLVIAPVVKARVRAVTSLSGTERLEGGFGHTGV
ncbi:MAG: dUTP diphosphatase [Clostridiales bacterium]|nr:dUTP diphosphatase [Clostridiales bacterium]